VKKYPENMEIIAGWNGKNLKRLHEKRKNGSSAREIHAEKSGFFF